MSSSSSPTSKSCSAGGDGESTTKTPRHQDTKAPGRIPIPEHTNAIGEAIVDSAFRVHKQLGPGLLERVYETCLAHEIKKRGHGVSTQVRVPIGYDGLKFDEGLRIDLLVNGSVLIKPKAVDRIIPVHKAQVLTYLKLTECRLGFLINFNVPLIRDGITRLVM